MKSQRRTKTPYTRESIERALIHHSARGGVETWHAPNPGESKWRVKVPGFDDVELSEGETWAFCVGLAGADRAAEPRVLRDIGKRLGPELLRWSRIGSLRAIAAGGGPKDVWDELVVYCPLCRCNKSGHRTAPNQITDACVDERCLCHDDDWET
jgi:hypothetical protein